MFNDSDDEVDPFNPFPEPVVVPITDVFDLHNIQPREVKLVVEEYLNEARRLGFRGCESFTARASVCSVRSSGKLWNERLGLKTGQTHHRKRAGWAQLLSGFGSGQFDVRQALACRVARQTEVGHFLEQ